MKSQIWWRDERPEAKAYGIYIRRCRYGVNFNLFRLYNTINTLEEADTLVSRLMSEADAADKPIDVSIQGAQWASQFPDAYKD